MELGKKMRENMSTRKCHIWLDARKFSSVKIFKFTVILRKMAQKGEKIRYEYKIGLDGIQF